MGRNASIDYVCLSVCLHCSCVNVTCRVEHPPFVSERPNKSLFTYHSSTNHPLENLLARFFRFRFFFLACTCSAAACFCCAIRTAADLRTGLMLQTVTAGNLISLACSSSTRTVTPNLRSHITRVSTPNSRAATEVCVCVCVCVCACVRACVRVSGCAGERVCHCMGVRVFVFI